MNHTTTMNPEKLLNFKHTRKYTCTWQKPQSENYPVAQGISAYFQFHPIGFCFDAARFVSDFRMNASNALQTISMNLKSMSNMRNDITEIKNWHCLVPVAIFNSDKKQ